MTEVSPKIKAAFCEIRFDLVIHTLFPGLVTGKEDGSYELPHMFKIGSVYHLAPEYHDESSTPKSLTPYMQGKPFFNLDLYMECGVESVTPPNFKMEYSKGPVWMTNCDPQSIEDAIRQMIEDCYD